MRLSDESLIVLCAMTAIAAQLDGAKLASDMRRVAAALVESCPDLATAAGGDAVHSMAALIERIS
jgi:hypothetical protein